MIAINQIKHKSIEEYREKKIRRINYVCGAQTKCNFNSFRSIPNSITLCIFVLCIFQILRDHLADSAVICRWSNDCRFSVVALHRAPSRSLRQDLYVVSPLISLAIPSECECERICVCVYLRRAANIIL